jgi:hypothetical protein
MQEDSDDEPLPNESKKQRGRHTSADAADNKAPGNATQTSPTEDRAAEVALLSCNCPVESAQPWHAAVVTPATGAL